MFGFLLGENAMLSKLKDHIEDSNKELSLSNNEVQITFTKQGYVTKLLYKGKNVLEDLAGEPHDRDKIIVSIAIIIWMENKTYAY